MEDREMIKKIQRGEDPDQGLLLQLWKKWKPFICKHCIRYQDRECIDDLIQDCYLVFYDVVMYYDLSSEYQFSTFLGNKIKWILYRRYAGDRPVIVSLQDPVYDDTDLTIEDTIPGDLDTAAEAEQPLYEAGMMEALEQCFDRCEATQEERTVFIDRAVKGLDYAAMVRIRGTSKAEQQKLYKKISNDLLKRRNNKPLREYMQISEKSLAVAYHCGMSWSNGIGYSSTEMAALIDMGLWNQKVL